MSSASTSKRRRLRKGTHSCWECKRRKIRCIFNPGSDVTICNGCRRRGSQCISQEFPEESSLSHTISDGGSNSDRRTPTTTPREDSRRTDHESIPTPVSMISEHLPQCLAFYKFSKHHTAESDFLPASQGKYEKLSRFLYEALPSREDAERICTASRHPSVLTHEILSMPYALLDQNGLATPQTLLNIPEPNTHPVLTSRYMLLLATFLQQLPPHNEIKGLPESPRAIMERLVNLVVSLVTTNDELLGSIEGLECIIIESVYQANIGNIRRSWVSIRRAMSIAQLMGLNRSDNQAQYKVLDSKSKTKYHSNHMWFRIVFLDRYLCLMLGVSQGCLDRSMASDAMLANDTPMGRLERIHCVIASRILERNESHPSSFDDIALMRTLDMELQRAARSLPSKWWLVPNLEIVSADSQALFWDTRRLFAQVLHYNLLNQLHLPYMLCSLSAERCKYEYSRITCVNASREMLLRFITLRRFNGVACSCRTIDFLALMAAVTLLLAHLDSHLSETENLLAHQYHSDRAMIEQVQENMEEVNRLNSDALSAQSADLLRRLLTIEIEMADCYPRRTKRVSVQKAGTEIAALPPDQDEDAVSVHIPYFGIIKTMCEGMSKEVPKPQATTVNPPQSQATTPADIGCGHVESPSMTPYTYPTPAPGANDVSTHFMLQAENGGLFDPLLPHGDYHGLAAGTEDWAFQGVDLAFFENLGRSAGNKGNEGIDLAFFESLMRSAGNEGNEVTD